MLVGHELQETTPVRDRDGKGRHTTVSREMVAIPGGGFIMDMPGVRGLGLWEADAGIGAAFADIEEAAVKKAIMDNADQVFVLADASKLDQTSFVKVDRLEKGSLITNRSNSPLVEQIKKKTKVIEV